MKSRYFKFPDGESVLALLDEHGLIWKAIPYRSYERPTTYQGKQPLWGGYYIEQTGIWEAVSA